MHRCIDNAQRKGFVLKWEPHYLPSQRELRYLSSEGKPDVPWQSSEGYAKYMKDLAKRRWGLLMSVSKQLSRMADLVETYPELLKMACDPLPVPRANWKHVVGGLRARASRVDPSKEGHLDCAYLFRYDLFQFVPSDESLKLFVAGIVKMLQGLPAEFLQVLGCGLHRGASQTTTYDNDDNRSYPLVQNFSFMGLSDTPFSKICLEADGNLDPIIVLNDMRTAVEGMAFVHTLADKYTDIKPRVLRTRWTPWSTDPFRAKSLIAESAQQTTLSTESSSRKKHTPVFMRPPAPHLDILSPEKLDKKCLRFYTLRSLCLHSPDEFEWIEAFCRTVRFLERLEHGGNFAYRRALDRQAQLDAEKQRKWYRQHLECHEYCKYGVDTCAKGYK